LDLWGDNDHSALKMALIEGVKRVESKETPLM